MENKNINEVSLKTPIEPEIECDGWYAICVRCKNEIDPHNAKCPYCHQMIDWSWLGKYRRKK